MKYADQHYYYQRGSLCKHRRLPTVPTYQTLSPENLSSEKRRKYIVFFVFAPPPGLRFRTAASVFAEERYTTFKIVTLDEERP